MSFFRRKVAVFDGGNDFVVFHAHREHAEKMVASRRARIFERDMAGNVKSLRLVVDTTYKVDARPGSFGAVNEPLASGHHCWKHNSTMEKGLCS